jgi:hypothetical protein
MARQRITVRYEDTAPVWAHIIERTRWRQQANPDHTLQRELDQILDAWFLAECDADAASTLRTVRPSKREEEVIDTRGLQSVVDTWL